ncbi:MAG: RIP metalloprotease RseP [Proteobacteria bacterium]|nr:RIP metalloprotease RseP [Pseudomonadota bacterium]
MALTQLILQNLFSFILITSVIVFIHELGHFLVARFCGVRIEEFSIGFGRELFGFTDKKGTRWKFCPIPFGGYVKMFGDKNGASIPDAERIAQMSVEEKKQSFLGKNVWQRMAIVVAGPVANFILAILIFTVIFRINGLVTTLPIIDSVVENSAATEAGLKKGDKILAINSKEIVAFEEIRQIVSANTVEELQLKILRNSEEISLAIIPKIQTTKNIFGEEVKVGMLGITASESSHQDLNLWQSFVEANKETAQMSVAIFKAIGELLTGKRSVEELGGPIKIAKYSGKTFEMGAIAVLWFGAMISLNLGVMNLLPIPVLDGGHLFFYVIEAIRGKALSEKIQQISFRFGLSLVLALMLLTTFNDIKQIVGWAG